MLLFNYLSDCQAHYNCHSDSSPEALKHPPNLQTEPSEINFHIRGEGGGVLILGRKGGEGTTQGGPAMVGGTASGVDAGRAAAGTACKDRGAVVVATTPVALPEGSLAAGGT